LGIAQIRSLPHDKFLDTLSLVDSDDNRKLDLHEFLNFMCIVEGILPSQSVEKGAKATRPKLGSVQLELSVVDRPEEYQVSIKLESATGLQSKGSYEVKVVLHPQIPGSAAKPKQKTEPVSSDHPQWNQTLTWMVPRLDHLTKEQQLKDYFMLVSVWEKRLVLSTKFVGGMCFYLSDALAQPIAGSYLLLDARESLRRSFPDA